MVAQTASGKPAATPDDSAASDAQSSDTASAAVVTSPASAGPDQPAPVTVAANSAAPAEKAKLATDAAPVSADVKAAGLQYVVTAGAPVHTAPVTNTQDAAKLVLTGVAGQSPSDQVSVALHRAGVDKASSVTIALNPAELGKVEVKLDFSKDGSVQASIVAERADTLQMLKNDHQGLSQALNNAGLSTDASSLNFSLGGDRQNQQAGQGSNTATPYTSRTNFAAETLAETPATSTSTRYVAADGRVDMLV